VRLDVIPPTDRAASASDRVAFAATCKASQKVSDRRRRCRALSRPDDAEVARMVVDFVARGGAVTVCTPAYVGVVPDRRRFDAA
jgi:hypothetical protein